MARKPNYDFEKRRKELARKQKQEEKRLRKREEQAIRDREQGAADQDQPTTQPETPSEDGRPE